MLDLSSICGTLKNSIKVPRKVFGLVISRLLQLVRSLCGLIHAGELP